MATTPTRKASLPFEAEQANTTHAVSVVVHDTGAFTPPFVLVPPDAAYGVFGGGKWAWYEAEKAGLFPPAITFNQRLKRYPSNELQAVLEARAAGANDDQVRALVRHLVAQRAERLAVLLEGIA